MKLITRTTLYFVAITLPVFAVGGILFYHSVRSVTRSDADEKLVNEEKRVLGYIKAHGDIPRNSIAFGDTVAFTIAAGAPITKVLKDTILYNSQEKEIEPYRMLVFGANTGNKSFRVIIFKPLIETDDLTHAILKSLAISGAILLLLLIVLEVGMSKTLWKPFYDTLEKLKSFNIAKGGRQNFTKSGISEFNVLNASLQSLTDKLSSDYKSLREFTENASHEIQTPLTIIQSKLELIIQSETLNRGQTGNIQLALESVTRLSKLNNALLLLTKIGNRQFTEENYLALDLLIKEKLEQVKEITEHRNLTVQTHLNPMKVKCNPTLLDILVGNLIGNAIKHNLQGGNIEVVTGSDKLIIKNTGTPTSLKPEELFARFKRANPSSGSLGLGLAIVKEICDTYGFKVNYDYRDLTHCITVNF